MRKAFIQLHLAILLAGFTAILGKLISLGEAPLVWWRLLLTVVVMWGYVLLSKQHAANKAAVAWQAMGVGAVVAVHLLMFFGSIKYSNVSIALVCFSASGFFSSLIEPLISKKKWSAWETLLGIISMAGIYIIFHFDTKYKVGIIMGVASGALSALFSVLNKQLVNRMNSISMTTYEMTGAFITISIIMPFYAGISTSALIPVGWDWIWLAILALLCTVWAFVLQFQALRRISAFTLNLSYNLEPVYGIVMAFLIFNENKYLSPQFYIGCALIVLAVLLQTKRTVPAT